MKKFTKTCTCCKEAKPLSEFSIYRATSDGLDYRCRTCCRAAAKAWAAANPEKVRLAAARRRKENPEKKAEWDRRHYERYHDAIRSQQVASRLMSRYGITLEDFDRILEEQGGRCPICGTDEPGKKGWNVDHDHVTGRVRGLLCLSCNLRLGHIEKAGWFDAAQAYLALPPRLYCPPFPERSL